MRGFWPQALQPFQQPYHTEREALSQDFRPCVTASLGDIVRVPLQGPAGFLAPLTPPLQPAPASYFQRPPTGLRPPSDGLRRTSDGSSAFFLGGTADQGFGGMADQGSPNARRRPSAGGGHTSAGCDAPPGQHASGSSSSGARVAAVSECGEEPAPQQRPAVGSGLGVMGVLQAARAANIMPPSLPPTAAAAANGPARVPAAAASVPVMRPSPALSQPQRWAALPLLAAAGSGGSGGSARAAAMGVAGQAAANFRTVTVMLPGRVDTDAAAHRCLVTPGGQLYISLRIVADA